jgi:hypothetical protein
MHAAQSLNQNSIVTRILLGPDSTLRTAMTALGVQETLLSRIEPLASALADDVADLARLGCRVLGDALSECREHADSGDMVGVADCLLRVVSAHRVAKNLLLGIVELSDTAVAELAQLGVNLAMSVLDDLGA